MLSLVERYSRAGVLLDTNIFLLLVIGDLDPSKIANFKRTRDRFNVRDHKTLKKFLNNFQKTIVTPHVLTEVSNLLGQIGSPDKEAVFSQFSGLILPAEEIFVPAANFCRETAFMKLGLTDCAIRAVSQNCYLVLTDDSALYQVLQHHQIDAVNFNHLRVQGWREN